MNASFGQSGAAPTDLDATVDQAIAARGRDARETVKALIVANDFLEALLDELRRKGVDRLRPWANSRGARRQG